VRRWQPGARGQRGLAPRCLPVRRPPVPRLCLGGRERRQERGSRSRNQRPQRCRTPFATECWISHGAAKPGRRACADARPRDRQVRAWSDNRGRLTSGRSAGDTVRPLLRTSARMRNRALTGAEAFRKRFERRRGWPRRRIPRGTANPTSAGARRYRRHGCLTRRPDAPKVADFAARAVRMTIRRPMTWRVRATPRRRGDRRARRFGLQAPTHEQGA